MLGYCITNYNALPLGYNNNEHLYHALQYQGAPFIPLYKCCTCKKICRQGGGGGVHPDIRLVRTALA